LNANYHAAQTKKSTTKKVIIDYLHWCNHDFELAPMVVLVHTIHHSNNNGIIVETVIDSYLLGLQTTLRFS
jgi:hypothetical protein